MKAELDFAGQKDTGGSSYKYIPFTPRELEQALSMYMTQGLNPSPQSKMKSKSQNMESIQGNDLVFRSIGENIDKRHNSSNNILRCNILTFRPLILTLIPTGGWIHSKTFKLSIHSGSTFTREH